MSQPWNPPPPQSDVSAAVPNYLIPAILSTVLCCVPLGVVSIIFAAQVNSKLAAGDMQGALESSKKAKMFTFIAIGAGLAVWVIVVILWVFVFGMAALSGSY